MYIIACRAHFLSLVWPWSGRSLPKGNQWDCWDPGLGPNVVGLPVHLPPQCTSTPLTPPNSPIQSQETPNAPYATYTPSGP